MRPAAQNPFPIYVSVTSVILRTLFMTWSDICYPIYDRRDWHSCPEHDLWKAFVDGVIDNNEKVVSSCKKQPNSRLAIQP